MGVSTTGLAGLIDRFAALPDHLMAATETAMPVVADAVARETQRLLELKSHPRHTPTPSRPGEPPARISGDLRDSVHAEHPLTAGYTVAVSVISDLDYSDIQEHGGRAGRGHRSVLPARPYAKPAAENSRPAIVAVLESAWIDAVLG